MNETEGEDSTAARTGLWLGPALAMGVLLLPTGEGLTPAAHRLAAVTALMATWWMTEALPVAVVSLLPLVLFPLLGIASATATAPSYGHDLVWLFFGGFQLAFAIERCGLHRRIALALVRLVGTRADRLVLGFMVAIAFLSMWLSNTSTTLMMLPVALAVAAAIEPDGRGPFGKALMLALAYGASVGGVATYLGTPPNVVFRGVGQSFGVDIGFGRWMAFATPLAALLVVLIWVYLTRIAWPVDRRPLPADHPASRALSEAPARWSPAEKRVALVFALAAAGWIARQWIADALGRPGISDTTIAIAVTVVLFLWRAPSPEGRRPLLDWATSSRTPWHILLLFGGGFALAAGFQETGLSAWAGAQLAAVVGDWPLPAVVLAITLFVTFLTELTSNTATATVLLPVVGGLAQAMGVPVVMLMVPATIAASCAFMLPVATPPNAIVYGSGHLRMGEMARAGLWINLTSAALITAWMLTVGAWLLA
ncbi:MAG: SLC13/DASS family transporter [Myxococcales bacterium]|nr:SLC13/DASS family transporter [Myxococcales bacterium]